MSMISEQVKELRYKADIYNTVGSVWELNRAEAKRLQAMLRQAADTIESLSAKLADMERSAEDFGKGWVYCDDRFPSLSEYSQHQVLKRLEIAYMKDTVEYLIGYYDGDKWMDKRHNIIKGVIAWRVFLSLSNERHEP